jgi:hypothetical protein
MRKNPAILFPFLILFAGACYTSSIPLNILVPATSPVDNKIKRISILPIPGTPSAPGKFSDIRFVTFDSTVDVKEIKMGYLHGMYDVLSGSPVFERVVFTDSAGINQRKGFYWAELKNICVKDTTDHVLVLNKIFAFNYGLSEDMYKGSNIYACDYVIDKIKWTIYDPVNEIVVKRYEYSDTATIPISITMKEMAQVLYDNCYYVGKLCGEKMTPHWKETNRTIYTGPGRDLQDAYLLVQKDQWYSASRIWNDMITSYGKRKASRAAFNMALAFEQNDDLDQATAWLNYADSLNSNRIARIYTAALKSRKNHVKELDKQILPDDPDEILKNDSIP